MKNSAVYVLLALTIFMSYGPASDAKASKKYTITERQVVLRKKVDSAVKSNELTDKEGSKLNQRLDDVDQDIAKMKAKNNGQLSYKDQGRIEKILNSISISAEKHELAKRVTPK